MQTVQFVALLLHILPAVIWIGGMVFLGIVLIPVLRDPSLRAQAVPLIQRTGRRFRNLGWTCFVILVVTVADCSMWVTRSSALSAATRASAYRPPAPTGGPAALGGASLGGGVWLDGSSVAAWLANGSDVAGGLVVPPHATTIATSSGSSQKARGRIAIRTIMHESRRAR